MDIYCPRQPTSKHNHLIPIGQKTHFFLMLLQGKCEVELRDELHTATCQELSSTIFRSVSVNLWACEGSAIELAVQIFSWAHMRFGLCALISKYPHETAYCMRLIWIFAYAERMHMCGLCLREDLNKKNVFFRALLESPKPPPWPQFGQLGPFFRTSKFKIWKSLVGRGGRYINNLKNS